MKSLLKKDKLLPLMDQMMVSATNFLMGIFIARLMGVEVYGRFALYWMVFLFLRGLGNAFIGLPAQVLSNTAKNKEAYLHANNRLASIITLMLVFVLYIVFYIYFINCSPVFGYGFWLFPLVIALFLKHEMNRKFLYASQLPLKVFLIDFTTYFLQLPLIVLLYYWGKMDLNAVLLTLTICGLLGQVVFALIKPGSENIEKVKMPVKENWMYGRFLIFTAVLQWFSGNIILVVSGGIIGVGAVGVIRVLQNIMGVLHVLFLTLENVIPVKASFLLNNHGRKYMFNYFKKVALVTGSIYGIILLTIKIFGSHILTFLYGESYQQYTYLLDLFVLVYIFIFIGTLAQIMIKTMQLNHGIFLAYLLTVLVATTASTPILNHFGIAGVIIGFGILQLTALSVYLFTLKKAMS